MTELNVGDRILYDWHGPCNVTFIGNEYIGICTEEGQHTLTRKDAVDFELWSEAGEFAWKAAIGEEKALAELESSRPWPESTFHHEPTGSEHFMGSHWDPFYEDGAEELLPRLAEILEKSVTVHSHGGSCKSLREIPADWQAGFHLIWPSADRGIVSSIATDANQNRFCTAYPFWPDGGRHLLRLRDVLIWESGVEVLVTVEFGEASLTFFDTLYLNSRIWYERGQNFEFSLTGIAYGAKPSEDAAISFTCHPEQIAWETELARLRREEPPEARLSTMNTAGAAFFLNMDEWDKDDYFFCGPVKKVTPIQDFIGQDGWIVRTTVLRQSGCEPEDFDLDILITRRVWNSANPPEAGKDIEGTLWLQGYMVQE